MGTNAGIHARVCFFSPAFVYVLGQMGNKSKKVNSKIEPDKSSQNKKDKISKKISQNKR